MFVPELVVAKDGGVGGKADQRAVAVARLFDLILLRQ